MTRSCRSAARGNRRGRHDPRLKVDDIVVDALARLGARAARADDPLGVEKGPMAWVVSESGLYTLILRSRGGDDARHPRASFSPLGDRRGFAINTPDREVILVAGGGADTVTLSLREAACYIVMVVPGRPPHVRRTRYEAILGEHTALDNQILCHALKSIECWWHKTEQIRSLGDESDRRGFAVDRLEHAVPVGGLLAEQIMLRPIRTGACYPRPGGLAQGARGATRCSPPIS